MYGVWNGRTITLTMSRSKIMFTALRTSCSSPCISKHMLLKTTSAPVAAETCLMILVTWVGLSVGGGNKTLNCVGSNQNEAM